MTDKQDDVASKTTMELAQAFVDKCRKDGVQFDVRFGLGLPTEDDALTVLCNARDFFHTVLTTAEAKARSEALEEAALVAEQMMLLLPVGYPDLGPFAKQDLTVHDCRDQIATKLRNLKSRAGG